MTDGACPTVLICHGFASSPASSKARALSAYLRDRHLGVEVLDLRVPDRNHLRLSAMIAVVQAAAERHGPVIVIGSSLGGLTAARAAERDPRVQACLLLAPAYHLVERWRERIGESAWQQWQERGVMDYDDYSTAQLADAATDPSTAIHAGSAPATYGTIHLDFGFIDDARAVDEGWPRPTVPTTIVHGVHDDVVPIALSRRYVSLHPAVRLREVDDGHTLQGSLAVIIEELGRLHPALRGA